MGFLLLLASSRTGSWSRIMRLRNHPVAEPEVVSQLLKLLEQSPRPD